MTHPNHQTNGASLEDCHTNFFALTDLCGIKWRKLVWGECGFSPEPLEDPVLSSFSRCLAVDILCVWRRVAPGAAASQHNQSGGGGLFDSIGLPPGLGPGPTGQHQQHPPLSLHAAKELWIFWYGEEPDLSGLVAPELIAADGEQGSWESGLSYECRSLLFKALHNLIERCLLSRDFVRIGKWFVQPYDGTEKIIGKSTHFSFSFAFFVHGESTVCASMDVRMHPLVRSLTRQHLLQAQTSTAGIPVLLAPFGLAGTLTGQAFKALDVQTLRQLEDWRQFYPIDTHRELLPPAVEVVVGGVKMRYPTCYVLVTDMDDPVPPPGMAKAAGGLLTPPGSPSCGHHQQSMQNDPSMATTLPEHVWQEGTMNMPMTGDSTPAPELDPAAPNQLGHWEFADPTRKNSCSCSKCRKLPFAKQLAPGKGGVSNCTKGAKGEKSEKGGRVRLIPFHRRPPPYDESPWGMEVAGQRLAGSVTPSGGPPSYQRGQSMTPNPLPNLHGSGAGSLGDSLPVPSMGSPASAAPSPLPNPHSQPASVPPQDATMPTLSPHPPASNPAMPQPATPLESQDKVTPAATPSDLNGPKSVSSVSNQVFSPYPATSSVEAPAKPLDSVGPPSAHSVPPAPPQPPAPDFLVLKRPVLSSKEYENILQEEETPSELLYDYSTLDAWLNHPVKRFKPCEGRPSECMRPTRPLPGDLYAAHSQHLASPPNNLGLPFIKQEIKQEPGCTLPVSSHCTVSSNVSPHLDEPFVKQEIKQEPGCNVPMEIDGVHITKRSDPYEFDDDMAAPAVSMEGFKRNNSIKEEDRKGGPGMPPFDPVTANGPTNKLTSGNLYTVEGLQVSYGDLDQIFDNSDDTSSDETLQVPTPPGSNQPPEECGGALVVKPPRNSNTSHNGGSGILRPEELSKMFPTPPSLEHNPISSPHMSDGPSGEQDGYRYRQEIYPNMGSPQEEHIEDWSYVFRPPQLCKLVGSSKYAPLTNLPSQSVPPLPPHCVYKPSWQHPPEKPPPPNPVPSHPINSRPSSVASNPHPPHPHHPRAGLSPISPAPFPPSPLHRPPCPPPPPYEQPSPATSTASSYLNRSVEPPAPARAPEASALVVNILLADTALNIFRDHNFDSCSLCVCNAGPKVVGNIKGADAGVYLPTPPPALPYPPSPYPGLGPSYMPSHHSPEDEGIRCSCGFSAVVNRRLSHRSGLFYEDELEITGLAEDPGERRKGPLHLLPKGDPPGDDCLPQSVLELLREQCVAVQSSSNSLYRAARRPRGPHVPFGATVNVLEFSDGNEVGGAALEQGRQAVLEATTVAMCKVEEMQQRQQMLAHGKPPGAPCVHRWPYLRAAGPHCNQDIVRVMKSLQPLLQDAIQKKCTTRLWEAPYTVSGPLTWRQFHRLAGRGADDRCEPQPIPSLVVGYEKDWLSLSPYALQYWEKLLLEPYSYARDVAYIVVAPDNDYILQRVRTFFKELSASYEVCRLGRHCPITKVLREGILRVGKTAAAKLAKEPVDEWFTLLGDNPTTNMLKLYAQVCRHHLAPHLSQVQMDKTLLEPPEGSQSSRSSMDRPMPSPMPPPSTPESNQSQIPEKAPTTPKSDHDGEASIGSRDPLLSGGPLGGGDCSHDDDDQEPPAVVVYLVDPFTMGSDSNDLQRLACLGLLRCFTTVLGALPETIRNNISVQLISLESIVELGRSRDRVRHNDHMRAQAFSVFSQCRRMLSHTSNIKALTGFGTAAVADLFLKSKDEKNRAPYRLYTPPYILAPAKEKVESGDTFTQCVGEQCCSVLYVSYCLSEDQRWLLAVATDERGEIFETASINIDIPNRSRRRKASARRIGLQKLMDFILGVMSQSVQPWRLVVGRIGRIGHGELKGWSWWLSRKSLLKASKHLKDICGQCNLMYPNNVPCVLSACLVSLEPDSTLRLMPDQFTPDERFSQASVNCQLSTPHDVSCTHILVFPTSATTQSSQTAFQEQQTNDPELGDEELFSVLDDDMPEGIDSMQDFTDIFTCWPETGPGGVQSPTGSPRGRGDSPSQPGSPSCGLGGTSDQHSPFPCNGSSRGGGSLGVDSQEEVGTLHQQPLALGYFVSTAPTGRMPRWFWASCPHLENVCPAFLKNALHLHSPTVQQNSDDLLQQQSNVTVHPLDSQYTTDVLRYVLEGYNALSWLALDSNTRDRLSCLPVHIQALMQLYHLTSALV